MQEQAQDNVPLLQTLSPTPQWLASSQEPALMPQLRIIDAHHHFSAHWGGYGLDELISDTGSGHRIEATVYMQCGWHYRSTGAVAMQPLGETEAVVALAEQARAQGAATEVAAGIVGYADLFLGDAVEEVLQAQLEAGKGRFRGIRYSAARHPAFRHGVLPRPPENVYHDQQFRAGFKRLRQLGLSFDAWVYHPQLGEVLDLARAFPDVPIILDHVGGILGVGPYAAQPGLAQQEWSPLMAQLAACPNVSVKIGGLGTTVFGFDHVNRQEPPSSEQLAQAWRPVVEETIARFGVQRCMFETNFPVDRASGSYGVVWNAFKRIAASASPSEQAALFHDNAARIYRLDLQPGLAN